MSSSAEVTTGPVAIPASLLVDSEPSEVRLDVGPGGEVQEVGFIVRPWS